MSDSPDNTVTIEGASTTKSSPSGRSRIRNVLILGTLLGIVLALLASWWSAPQWIPPLAEELADRAGVQIRRLDMGRPGWGGWLISDLQLEVEGNAFQVSDMVLGWKCCQNVEQSLSASIQHLEVLVKTSDSSESKSFVAVSALLQTLHQRIPFLSVSVDSMELFSVNEEGTKLFDEKSPDKLSPGGSSSRSKLWDAPVSMELKRKPQELALTVKTDYLGQLIETDMSWTFPGQMQVAASFSNAEVSLEGKLSDRGLWEFQGAHFIDIPTVAIFTMPDVPLKRHFETLLAKGSFRLTLPDVLFSAPWTLEVENNVLGKIVEPQMTIEGEQKVILNGTRAPEHFKLSPPTLNVQLAPGSLQEWLQVIQQGANFLPAESIAKRWQLALNRGFDCDLPVSEECWQTLPLKLSSLGNRGTLAAEADATVKLSEGESFLQLELAITQSESRPLARFPKTASISGKVRLDHISDTQVSGVGPVTFNWGAWEFPLSDDHPNRSPLRSDGTLSLKKFSINLADSGGMNLSSDVTLDASLTHKQQSLPLKLEAPLNVQPGKVILGRGTLNSLGLRQTIEANYDLAQQKGWLSLQGDGTFKNLAWIQSWVPAWKKELKVSPGSLNHVSFINIDLQRSPMIQGRTQGQLEKWGVEMDPRYVRNIAARADVQFTENDLRFVSPLELSADNALASVPLINLSSNLKGSIRWAEGLHCDLQLMSAGLETFGGSLTLLKEAPIDCPLTTFLPIQLKDLDLGQLVAVENENVQATGKIAGFLPINIHQGQFSISGGQVAAQAPGTVKLLDVPQWRQMAGENQAVMFAVDALQNFHYQSLTSSVDYAPEGKLMLGVAMKGSNPDFRNGTPVNYNLNVESNIISLLRSLEIPDDLIKRLEERYMQ
ncbi:YdbH domain-containing protein [Hahella ganghwensis]|uniref:YdbH domain-containing protein n=1 Tax=Hahella ganghwensis TaxID=286420 RepID=UPI000476C54C|nr:YdbH domain-containing protein [Hahella ganghwensis]